ncbi:hypothetical protein ACHWQZ_G017337 [Mnemiopsis leidyi]
MLKVGLTKILRTVVSDKAKIGSCISKTFFSADMSPPIVIPPKGPHQASVIFLHGLGDTGHGWSQVMAEDLNLDNVKFICPTASTIPVTINMGYRMPAWYDITSLSEFDKEDKTGIMRIVGLSCYLPLNTEFPDSASSQNSSTPIIMCHGKADVVVDFRFGQMSYQKIKAFHSAVDLKSYENMGHTSCPRELMDVKNFLSQQLSA